MTTPSEFPIDAFDRIKQSPGDFRLLERVPITRDDTTFPIAPNPPVGDDRPFIILDVETTGFDPSVEKIIEIGLVTGLYSPSANRITQLTGAYSQFEDPGKPIPEEITRITGITDDDVAGQRIDDDWLLSMFEGDPLVLAHNAGFDRPFTEARFPGLANSGWACTIKGIDWAGLGFESSKLEYLLLRHGYFYQGHRASIDCLATAWLLHANPEAFPQLLASARQPTVVIRAFGAPFEVKDQLKSRGYRWHAGDEGSNKCWWTEIPETDLQEEQRYLAEAYPGGSDRAHYERRTARTRFIGPLK